MQKVMRGEKERYRGDKERYRSDKERYKGDKVVGSVLHLCE